MFVVTIILTSSLSANTIPEPFVGKALQITFKHNRYKKVIIKKVKISLIGDKKFISGINVGGDLNESGPIGKEIWISLDEIIDIIILGDGKDYSEIPTEVAYDTIAIEKQR